jgi:hypothetical protein
MTGDELREILKGRGAPFGEKPVQNGTRFDCKSGELFNVRVGVETLTVHGDAEVMEELELRTMAPPVVSASSVKARFCAMLSDSAAASSIRSA